MSRSIGAGEGVDEGGVEAGVSSFSEGRGGGGGKVTMDGGASDWLRERRGGKLSWETVSSSRGEGGVGSGGGGNDKGEISGCFGSGIGGREDTESDSGILVSATTPAVVVIALDKSKCFILLMRLKVSLWS